ncbi:hypothetical protein B9Q03_06670 [Candidatus Marsarchaeota G2 archaeon OSP_D]|jgi:RNase P/RNase MRP subunit p29|uniref:Uncharacterized protein n=7 Tax=Candidatus Marsarchaeota group 2 TaxID=2203771 RepID=A0A2R6C525_9ARCH|nr:MAG: hypothetical protein B9Q03_06670 [Candidatus Marsarchaeota G2 archaeon OSP_D]PSN91867.1 MAG: hypothetical protein B9Q08_02115 [Candidatus Marsarchaeota G2 archaeon ECH_B_SAG-M15]PSN96046.1 MAG: hypothetical protein B9Q09_02565 [Candidatus Marsarchaeota G2 archaeon ECH_B_SAG-C16]PSN96816.1 MAG: hypothetical protein B9Q06_01380 [Candidatus Marsarchaeota G2 archaeon ECH_B_2]PSO01385.1 MAG: hypothetical protein B9Q07_00790 [Candidatus Marsarchaeota G2 archaeon ECH_B_3]PSO03517.1 MAG: hypot
MSKTIGSLIGLEVVVHYKHVLITGIVFQETRNMVKLKVGDKSVSFPKKEVTLILNESKVKGLHLLGLAWNRLKR